MNGSFFVVILLVVVLIGIIMANGNQKTKRIELARANYQSSLEQLKAAPGDTDLRQEALSLGREYARRARAGGQETLFDEVALMNDINVVTSGASIEQTKEQKENSASDRLNELKKLKDQGLISEDEYIAKRAAILDKI